MRLPTIKLLIFLLVRHTFTATFIILNQFITIFDEISQNIQCCFLVVSTKLLILCYHSLQLLCLLMQIMEEMWKLADKFGDLGANFDSPIFIEFQTYPLVLFFLVLLENRIIIHIYFAFETFYLIVQQLYVFIQARPTINQIFTNRITGLD